ncbi:MAG: hypothetical protein ACD_28C00108G0019 [uncultured bacterium]|nr:MAG: hypothetical protein ACD_28C00108G0019 [uncultured bacterium]KKT76086.1 MAG: 6-carboxy-5,6,7,8-tetrahydropterin synthase [Candidatus Peregrinibacteria bacterium GW2011_GWA2_44_7]
MLITKIFIFDAAHALTRYYGKCENVHGHTYRLEVTVEGEMDSNGLVIDFVILKRIVQRQILGVLDHQNLNDHFENPSAELVCRWIWDRLFPLASLLQQELKDPNLGEDLKRYLNQTLSLDCTLGDPQVRLFEVKLWETENSGVAYRGV